MSTYDKSELPSELVLVCRICGHISPGDVTFCDSCWSPLSGLTPVSQREARRLARRHHLWRRLRNTRFLLFCMAVAVGLISWKVVALFDLVPLVFPPPAATTNLSASIGPQTWAQVRWTPESTGNTPDPGPHPPIKTKWVYATSKAILAPPTVLGDRVYLTSEDGRAIALDRETGQPVWEYQTGNLTDSAPAVAGDLLVIGLRDKRVVALQRENGSVRWGTELGGPGMFGGPRLGGTDGENADA